MAGQTDDLQFVVAVPSMAAPLRDLPLRSCRTGWLQRVGSSSWQNGEAAVRRRLTLERQVTNTLLPDCAIKPPAAEAEKQLVLRSRERCCNRGKLALGVADN